LADFAKWHRRCKSEPAKRTQLALENKWRTTMNRIMTALALSGMFVAAPAFAKTTHQGRRPVVSQKATGDKPAGEKKAAGDKAAPTGDKAAPTGGDKAAGSETKAGSTDATGTEAKPVKKTKKSTKKSDSSTSTSTEKPAEAPAK
jgi:type IV secretory pathway TrbL component